MTKRSTLGTALALFFFLAAAGAVIGRAQVVPSATRSRLSVTAGGFASAFQPDYAGFLPPGTAPNRLYGIGAFVDVRFSRWIQAEAEGRWLRFNEFDNISEDNYLIGPRLPIHTFKIMHATPYGKVLVGMGRMNFVDNLGNGRYTDIAYGGGVDFKLTRRFSARGDFEYQMWPNWPGMANTPNTPLYPYGVSAGIGYKIF
jgi:hypothetical protein